MDEAAKHPFEGLMTADEAAEELKVHRRTIRRWIESGKLPGKKFGRDYLTHIDFVSSPTLEGARRSDAA